MENEKIKISNETKTKATFTFVILKLLEMGSIFGLTFGVYYLGKWANKSGIFNNDESNWINGLLFIFLIIAIIGCLIGVIYIGVFLLSWFIKLNWRWALILSETPEEKMIREKSESEKRLLKLEKNKKQFIKEHGFWIGDKVKIVKGNNSGKIVTVKEISNFWSSIRVKEDERLFPLFTDVEPIRRKNEK